MVSSAVTEASKTLDLVLAGGTVDKGTLCEDCEKVPGRVLHMNVRRCFPCWDTYQRSLTTKDYGTCEFCGKLPTTYLTVSEAKWICHSCWNRHDKPEIVREEDLRPRDQQAMQARRAGGSI